MKRIFCVCISIVLFPLLVCCSASAENKSGTFKVSHMSILEEWDAAKYMSNSAGRSIYWLMCMLNYQDEVESDLLSIVDLEDSTYICRTDGLISVFQRMKDRSWLMIAWDVDNKPAYASYNIVTAVSNSELEEVLRSSFDYYDQVTTREKKDMADSLSSIMND